MTTSIAAPAAIAAAPADDGAIGAPAVGPVEGRSGRGRCCRGRCCRGWSRRIEARSTPGPLRAPAGRWRCPRPGPATSRRARCSIASGRWIDCRNHRAHRRPAAPWCTACWSRCSAGRPLSERPTGPQPRSGRHGSSCPGRIRNCWTCCRPPTWPPGWSRRRIWSGPTSPWRIHGTSIPRRVNSPSRSSPPEQFRCAATWTGSTWRRPGNCGWSTTRPAAPPVPISRQGRSTS